MRSRFLLLPAALVATAPVQAHEYMTVAQAQKALFPGAAFAPRDFVMEIDQVSALMKAIDGASVYHYTIKAWKVSTGGTG